MRSLPELPHQSLRLHQPKDLTEQRQQRRQMERPVPLLVECKMKPAANCIPLPPHSPQPSLPLAQLPTWGQLLWRLTRHLSPPAGSPFHQ